MLVKIEVCNGDEMKQSAGSGGKLTMAALRLKTAVNISDDHNEAQGTP